MVALIGAVLCVGVGFTVKSMFEGVISCFVANLQGVTAEGCASGGPPGGGGGPIGPGITPGPSPTPSATPTPSPTPTPTPTP